MVVYVYSKRCNDDIDKTLDMVGLKAECISATDEIIDKTTSNISECERRFEFATELPAQKKAELDDQMAVRGYVFDRME